MYNYTHDTSVRKLRVFLCHASEDKPVVRDICQKLKKCNVEPWLDEKDLLPGQNWEQLIPDVIRRCDIILICLSRTFLVKQGYRHSEIHLVLEAAKRKPPNTIYHIPFRLDNCEMPSYLEGVHYASNLVPEDFDKLLAACEKSREWLNTTYGMHIEPLQNTVSNHSFDPHAPQSNFFPQTFPQPNFANTPTSGAGSPSVDSLLRSDSTTPSAQRQEAQFGRPFPEVWNVPRRHNAFFTGRAPALNRLFDTFRLENEAGMIPPQTITGLGGMGKTQTAAEYAYRFRGDYQAVLWVRAETQESLLADFRAIAGLLKYPQKVLREQTSLMQIMREWFMAHGNWLLIFDNADNPSLVDPFIPRAARGHILTTTRAGAVVGWAQNPLPLEALEDDDGALCILRRAGLLKGQQQLSAAHPADVDAARQLAQMMEGLPLALEQAGAYIDDTACGVGGYRKLYNKFRKEIQPVPSGEVRDYPETVVSVWRISRSAVEQSNPAAAELLRLCAFLAPDGIPDEMVIAGADALGPVLKPAAANQFTLNMPISVLRKYSLLNRDVDREMDLTRLSIHRIMQEILVDEMDKQTQRLWAERAVRTVELGSQSMPWAVLQSQARHCQDLIEQWHMTFAEAKRLLQWIEKNERPEKR